MYSFGQRSENFAVVLREREREREREIPCSNLACAKREALDGNDA